MSPVTTKKLAETRIASLPVAIGSSRGKIRTPLDAGITNSSGMEYVCLFVARFVALIEYQRLDLSFKLLSVFVRGFI